MSGTVSDKQHMLAAEGDAKAKMAQPVARRAFLRKQLRLAGRRANSREVTERQGR
jgi:hypothetical protein